MTVLAGMLLMFVITLAIGHWIRKTRPESYKGFVINFGRGVALLNMIVVGMLMMTDLPYIDKASHAMLPFITAMIMITLISKNNGGEERGDNQQDT